MFCAVARATRSQVSNHRGLPVHGPLEAVSSGVRRRKRSHGVCAKTRNQSPGSKYYDIERPALLPWFEKEAKE